MNDLLKIEYPFQEHYFVTPSRHRIHYVDEGSTGTPIVMVHGNPTWSFFYRKLIRAMAPNQRCLAIDHLGCGLSDKPQDFDYCLQQHADNVTAWIDSLNLKSFHLVVHDWGGPIGLLGAFPHWEKVQKVVLLNTAAFVSERIPRRIALCKTPWLSDFLIRRLNAFALGATRMATVRKLTKLEKKGFLYPYSNYNNRIAIKEFVRDIPLNPMHRSFETLQHIEQTILPKLNDRPVKIIWGERDFCFNLHFLSEWEKRLPQAEVVPLDDTGHYLLEDNPSEVIEQIQTFL